MTRNRTTLAVFLCACLYLAWISASRVYLGDNDEGIYMDAARRTLSGQMPYKDFFTFSGPGSFVLMAASFRVFGVKLAAARIPVIFDLALMASCVCWLTWRLAGRSVAVVATLAFLSFETLWQGVLANHRWDSSAWMTLAATLVFFALENPGHAKAASAAAGAAAAIAVFCTPPVALAAAALAVCMAWSVDLLVPWLAGALSLTTLGVGWLAWRGALLPMIRGFGWTASNYTIANHSPYGWIIGGYPHLFQGASTPEALVTAFLLVFITLPATLPIVSALWLWKRPPRNVAVLLSVAAALLLSSYPRWDLIHLNYVAALFYVLAAVLIHGVRFRNILAVAVIVVAVCCAGIAARQRWSEQSRPTGLGIVHGPAADLQAMTMLNAHIHPSDTLFVFPYRPVLYFLTLTRNPTRYSFLQPGMFPESDTRIALQELQAEPPRWMVFMDIPESEFLRLWPGSDPGRLRIPGIESFIHDRYRKVDQVSDFQLLELRGAAN